MMYLSRLTIENFRLFGQGSDALELDIKPGLTALVGENDSGKTAIVDAIRLVLGTRDQEFQRILDSDFHAEDPSREIRITCRFEGLSTADRRVFLEFLTYEDGEGGGMSLYVNLSASNTGETRRGRPYRHVALVSGVNRDGPSIPQEVRDFLRVTYLRPLRDADGSLSAGRRSRLSEILLHSDQIRSEGTSFEPGVNLDPSQLNVLGIGDFADSLLRNQTGVQSAKESINDHLGRLLLSGEEIAGDIGVGGLALSDESRLRQLLEKLELSLGSTGKPGLGSNNLLFVACELLLLAQEEVGPLLLLIEEPEAHLHAQRQLRLMDYLQGQARSTELQIVVTTHSPNLASSIDVENMVIVSDRCAFPLGAGQTELERTDYRFLRRFLDVTKANLFFAKGVLIVEGDAENILLPTLARLIGADLTEHGVSIVNVGGVGLRRYARIFQRSESELMRASRELAIPVACITDLDVMPNCAEELTGLSLVTKSTLGDSGIAERVASIEAKASGQPVRTFVANEWTLEYDLAFHGLAEDVYVSACLAKKDRQYGTVDVSKVTAEAETEFMQIKSEVTEAGAMNRWDSCPAEAILASTVYAEFTKGTRASKAIAAQYLAGRLEQKFADREGGAKRLRESLPQYLLDAIEYVCREPKKGATCA